MFLPRQQHLEKTRAVKKWLDNEPVTDEEMKWIEKIKKRWTEDKDNLPGFAEFKAALDDILGISAVVSAPQSPQLPERPQRLKRASKKWECLFCCCGKGSAAVADRDSNDSSSNRKLKSASKAASQ